MKTSVWKGFDGQNNSFMQKVDLVADQILVERKSSVNFSAMVKAAISLDPFEKMA